MEREKATAAVNAIISDLCNRRGLRQAWEDIDEDIRQQILDKWVDLVERAHAD